MGWAHAPVAWAHDDAVRTNPDTLRPYSSLGVAAPDTEAFAGVMQPDPAAAPDFVRPKGVAKPEELVRANALVVEEPVRPKAEELVRPNPEELVRAKPEELVRPKPEESVRLKPEELVRAKAEELVRTKPEELVRARTWPEELVRARPVELGKPSMRDAVELVRPKLRMNGLALRRSSLVLTPALDEVRWIDVVRVNSAPHQLRSACSEDTTASSEVSFSLSSISWILLCFNLSSSSWACRTNSACSTVLSAVVSFFFGDFASGSCRSPSAAPASLSAFRFLVADAASSAASASTPADVPAAAVEEHRVAVEGHRVASDGARPAHPLPGTSLELRRMNTGAASAAAPPRLEGGA